MLISVFTSICKTFKILVLKINLNHPNNIMFEIATITLDNVNIQVTNIRFQ